MCPAHSLTIIEASRPLVMQRNTILTVGIADPEFLRCLESYGYSTINVAAIADAAGVSAQFDLLIVLSSALPAVSEKEIERLYFVSNSRPVALLIQDPAEYPKESAAALYRTSLEIIYGFEQNLGTLRSRIDRIINTGRLNARLFTLQGTLTRQESLEREISLREHILNHERDLNANIITSITTALFIIDINGTIVIANDPARSFCKRACDELIGTEYTTALPPPVSDAVSSLMQQIAGNGSHSTTRKCTIDDAFYTVYACRMLDYQNNPTGILLLLTDITEQENLNILLYRSEKLATVGTMLSGIAHELRNPLTIISARIQRATAKIDDRDWLEKTFNSIKSQTGRCASIVNSLLNFTRNTATSAGYHTACEILDETLTYIEYQNVFDNITVRKEYDQTLLVYGDRSRFVQVFLNLITNAADAMKGTGVLTIRVTHGETHHVRIEINDSGTGIDPAIRKKIFDPFFTTKDPGKGTGLGLAIVYKIIQESNGTISLTSVPGNTSFFVELPSEKERSRNA